MADNEGSSGSRPSMRAFFANWSTYDAPFTTKVRMAVSNNLTKFRTKSNCCGHPGEPGC